MAGFIERITCHKLNLFVGLIDVVELRHYLATCFRDVGQGELRLLVHHLHRFSVILVTAYRTKLYLLPAKIYIFLQ